MSQLFHQEHHHHQRHGVLTARAATAGVVVAFFLLLLKTFGAIETDSVAMLGSLADTGLDFLASLVTLYGVRLAAIPADWNHRFGHG
jgi:ferrous-iron efflux pump FieF